VGEKPPTKEEGVASIVVSPRVSNLAPTHYLHDGSKSYLDGDEDTGIGSIFGVDVEDVLVTKYS